jgi:WD40 repeat protein
MGDINEISFSPDGKYIVTASQDKTAKIWEVKSGKLFRTLEGHTNSVFSAVFSPDSKNVVTISKDNTVKTWDIATGQIIGSFEGKISFDVAKPLFSPDRKSILMDSDDDKADSINNDSTFKSYIRVFNIRDVRTGDIIQSIKGHINDFLSCFFSPDGNFLVTMSDDGSSRIWNVRNGELLHVLPGTSANSDMASWMASNVFSSDSRKLLTIGFDMAVKIWDCYTGKLLCKLKGHPEEIVSVDFTRDGKMLAALCSDNTVFLWDAGSGKLLNRIIEKGEGFSSVKFIPDGKNLLISSKIHGYSLIQDIQTGQILFSIDGGDPNAFSPDGKSVVTTSNIRLVLASSIQDGIPKLWDMQNGRLIHKLKGATSYVSLAKFSPDGQNVMTNSWDWTAKLWDLKNGKLKNNLAGHGQDVESIQYSRDGSKVLTGSYDKTAKVWNLRTGKLLFTIKGRKLSNDNPDPFSFVFFSPDSKIVAASITYSDTVSLFNAETGEVVHYLKAPDQVIGAGFNPDGTIIVVESRGAATTAWDVQSGNLLYSLEAYKYESIYNPDFRKTKPALFSPDGNNVVTFPEERMAEIWNVADGELVFTIDSIDKFPDAPFSPDSKYIAVIANRNTDYDPLLFLEIYDVNSGKLIRSIDFCQYCDYITIPNLFSFDSKIVIIPLTDGTIHLVDFQNGEILRSFREESFGWGLSADEFRFSPGNDKLILENTGGIKILDIGTGTVLKSMNIGNSYSVVSEIFSPDGTRFLTFTDKGDAEIWDAQSLEKIQKLNWHFGKPDDPLSVAEFTFSDDGKRIITRNNNLATMIWDVQSGKVIESFTQQQEGYYTGTLSPDGMKAVCHADDRGIKIRDLEKKIWLPRPEISDSWILQQQFSPDGRTLLIGIDSTIKLFDVQTGGLLLTLMGAGDNSNPAVFSPDGQKIMLTTGTGLTRIWNAQDGQLLSTLDSTPLFAGKQSTANSREVQSGPVVFSPDGQKIVIEPDIWNAADGSLLHHLPVEQFSVEQFSSLGAPLSPDSKKMVMNFTDESQKIRAKSWDVQNGKLLQDLSWRTGNQYYSYQQIRNIRFSPDGKRIVTTAPNDSIIRVWDSEAGELIFSLSCDEGKPAFAYFSSDGKNIISWMNNGTIKTWNIQNRELIKSESWPETLIEPFFYWFISSNDVKMLASFSDNWDVGIWDIQGRRFLHKLEGKLKNISFASFSPDGTKIMAEASSSDTIRMWNVQNGNLLYSLNANEEGLNDYADGLGSLCFSPDGSKIIASRNNVIKIWDPESAELLHSLNGPLGFSPSITNLSEIVSRNSRLVMAFTYDNDTVKVWDLQSGKLQFCLDVIEEKKKVESNNTEPAFIPQEGIKSALFSDDGKSFRTITTTGEVKIWNALNGKLLQSSKEQDQSIEPAGIVSVNSPDLMKKVSFLWDGTALLWKLVDGQWTLILSMEGSFSPVVSAKFHPDNNQLFVAYADSSAKIWDVQTGEMLYALERQSGFVTTPRFSPDGMNLVTFLSDSTAKIWDIQTGKGMNTLEGKVGKIGSITFSSDSRKLLVTNSLDNSAKIWDIGTGRLLNIIEGVFWKMEGEEEESEETVREVTFTSDGTKIISASLKPPDLKQMSTTLWDVESGEALHSLDGFVVNSTDNFKDPFSPDSKKLVTASEGGITKIWNVQTGKVLHILDPQDGIRKVNTTVFSPDGKNLLVSSSKYKTEDDLISEYPVEIWDSGNGKLLRSIDFKSAKLQDICWSGSKLIYTYNTAISLYDLKSGKEIVTFVSINKDDYVFILPSGEYSGTPEGIKNLVWRLGDKLYNVNQWDLQYNRPDKVLEQLGNPDTALIRMYRKAYQKRLKRAGFTEEMLSTERHTPGIKIVNYDTLAYNTDKSQIQLEICGTDSKYKLDRFNVWINDVPMFGSRGISLIKENTDSINKIINVPLSDGKNEINVSCINEKGVESLKESVNIIYHPENQIKPDLYVIAMSVSRYKDPRYNLQYAVKDGRDIASIFRSLAIPEGYFGNIIIDTLFNERATRENFFNLKQKLSASKVDDQVVVFVSGHGLLDRDMDFYFASFDVDFSQPEKRGISFDDLEALLDSIPARKKLMLMDACHSGEVDKEEGTELIANNMQPSSEITFRGNIKEYDFKGVNNKMVQSGTSLNSSFELMQELFTNLDHGTGTTVISAAAGKGYALESPQWNNGVFTYSIINGLMNKAADSNNDKQITVSELKDYSINQVQQLTGGKQKPTTRKESLAVDWRVW